MGAEFNWRSLQPRDFPQANRLTIHILAAVAENEAVAISALAAAKARGTVLGGRRTSAERFAVIGSEGRKLGRETRTTAATKRNEDLLPVIEDIRTGGAHSLRQIAAGLNERGITTARGGSWFGVQVGRLLASGRQEVNAPHIFPHKPQLAFTELRLSY